MELDAKTSSTEALNGYSHSSCPLPSPEEVPPSSSSEELSKNSSSSSSRNPSSSKVCPGNGGSCMYLRHRCIGTGRGGKACRGEKTQITRCRKPSITHTRICVDCLFSATNKLAAQSWDKEWPTVPRRRPKKYHCQISTFHVRVDSEALFLWTTSSHLSRICLLSASVYA